MGLPTNEERASSAIESLKANLLGYETILSNNRYLAGEVHIIGFNDISR